MTAMSEAVDAPHRLCANGCTEQPDAEGHQKPLVARHGHFCNREYNSAKAALENAPGVVSHVVSLVASRGQSEENIQSSREAPLPFNVQAFQDANELYMTVVYWCHEWAVVLKRERPDAANRAWRNDAGTVIGLPPDMSPHDARAAVHDMTRWLLNHLEDVFWQEPGDVLFMWEQLQEVFRVAVRWPASMQPRYAKVPCPGECQGRISVHPPESFMDHTRIVCEKCGRIFGEDEFEHEIRVFKQLQDEEDKARKVMQRLMRKYVA